MWWIRELLSQVPNGRPKLFWVQRGRNIEISGVRWINSPSFHFELKDTENMHLHDFEIWVDHKGQLELGKLFYGEKLLSANGFIDKINGVTLPMYAFNTDGIDPHGRNILIERLNITNQDDAIAIKPSHQDYVIAKCTENVIVRDCNIWFGVGMTIGSVPASDKYYCVNNVTFSNHKFYHPWKAVYVKTNPGTTQSMLPGSGGIISNIVYENLEIHHPMWWSIYIGPQQ